MLDTPQITQTTAQLNAIIHLTIPRDEIRNVMGPGIGELMAAIAAQGIAPAGPVFSHHLPNLWECYVRARNRTPTLPPGARSSTGH